MLNGENVWTEYTQKFIYKLNNDQQQPEYGDSDNILLTENKILGGFNYISDAGNMNRKINHENHVISLVHMESQSDSRHKQAGRLMVLLCVLPMLAFS